MSPSDGCSCGYSSARRWTRCPECDARRAAAPGCVGVRWSDRLPTEWHRVPCGTLGEALGGGIAPGAVVLVTGAPGAGKTTLAIDALTRLGGTMISLEMGEPTLADYARRAEIAAARPVRWLVTDEPRIDRALLAASGMLVVLDSLAVVEVAGRPGAVARARGAMLELAAWARSEGKRAVIAIAHQGDDGRAVPRVARYLADAELSVRRGESGEREIVVDKNRHGPTGVFALSSPI